jgi:eukaryotic-like serine/threonine-protein kinase
MDNSSEPLLGAPESDSSKLDSTRIERKLIGERYQVLAEIGKGGMAVVYLVRTVGQGDFSKLAVVKRPFANARSEDDDEGVASADQMFADEARLAAKLNHPNIVQTFETGHDNEGAFTVMEYLEGHSLSALVQRGRKTNRLLPLGIHLHALSEILGALEYAHDLDDHDGTKLNLVHRDVSPSNVFLTYQGRVKLVDFGIAKAANTQRTEAGVLKGKVVYMAPEQVNREGIDRRTDLFSVGIMLWEALYRMRFWGKKPELEILRTLVGSVPFEPAAGADDIPLALREVCNKAIALDREHRYQTAREMQEALDAAIVECKLSVTVREVSSHVSDQFSAERAQMKSAIEAALRDGSPIAPIRLDPIRANSTGSNSSVVAQLPTLPVPSEQKKRTAMFAGSGIACTALVVGGILLTRGESRVDSPRAPRATPIAVATVDPVVPAAVGEADVSIEISVTPLIAGLTLDGRALGANPFRGKLPKDDTEHTLIATAKGYETKTVSMRFDRSRSVDFSMQKIAVIATGMQGVPVATTKATGKPETPAKPESGKREIQELTPADKRNNQPSIDTDVFKK